MINIQKRLTDFFLSELWEIDTSSLSRVKVYFIKFLRLIYVAIREFSEGMLNLRAMSLVYTTLLSIVPLLAVSFSVLKAFGVHNQIAPFLQNFLAPLGPKGIEISDKIIGFVGNMKVGILGSIGLALLIYTVISLIKKVEDALNHIWKIKKSRSFARRFSDYMSVILIGPVLIFSSIGIGASIMSGSVVQKLISIEPFGFAIYFSGKIVPYIFICGALTFFYIFIPNAKVRFSSALVGGIFSGVLWQSTEWAFAAFIVSSTKYTAIYSGFAILILFMIWLYIGWLIVLVGAQVSFYHQYPQLLNKKKELISLSNRLKERLAFLSMFFIAYNYLHNKEPWTLNSLVERLRLPFEPVQNIVRVLEKKGFILETGDEPPAYVPARDIDTIKLKEILNSVRVAEEDSFSAEDKVLSIFEVDNVLKKVDNFAMNALGDETIKSLVLSRKGEI
jgi:membrane protein